MIRFLFWPNDNNVIQEIAMEEPTQKRRRGKGKKPALAFTSIRLEPHIMRWYRDNYPTRTQAKMREVLREFVERQNTEPQTE